MEILWGSRIGKFKRRVSLEEQLDCILPIKIVNLSKDHSQSLFPLLRLYCPDKDNTRTYAVTEKAIAKAYCRVLGLEDWATLTNLDEWTELRNILQNFRDPKVVPSDLVGDLSLVIELVMNERTNYTPSTITVKDANDLLDELAALDAKNCHGKKHLQGENEPKTNLLEAWLRNVIHDKRLSPLEHKWLVRIILKDTSFGIRSSSILRAYSPYANGLLLAVDGNLKRLCDKLAGPNFY